MGGELESRIVIFAYFIAISELTIVDRIRNVRDQILIYMREPGCSHFLLHMSL